MDPSFLILQLLSYPNTDPTATPKPLPTDDATNRAVSVLDRTPLVDLHKIGVVYAAPGQTEEAEILFNCAGSRFYGLFLQSLGRLVRLKGCREVYTGGLDTSDDVDGKYAVYSQDHLSQTIFHCTTLMPSPEHDPLSTGKKRHIGNDFITIIWNESGLPFAFDTIPAQFNFVNIIIEPVGSMNEKGIGVVKQYNEHMFKAYAQFREDMPEVGALWDPKLISGAALGSFVKQTAVQCNIFAQIFWQCVSGNMYTSNARERLRQINRMKNRVVANAPERPGSAGGGDAGSGVGQGLDLNVLLDFSRFT
ncbi:Tuberous sclerosis 2-like protein [Rhizophlyctis rosea]|uniref:Tuberous sclerosis 2-like protein n=1 Tax=Rhizophlyctis rosea TaxID=64517 RepID=A0AAD5SFI4_9FUNG|nr:Tuberous sclerosis 2-like protein [Rhizophlyctis rosea]